MGCNRTSRDRDPDVRTGTASRRPRWSARRTDGAQRRARCDSIRRRRSQPRSARSPTLGSDASPRGWCGLARRPGTVGPHISRDHSALHTCRCRTSPRGPPSGAPPRLTGGVPIVAVQTSPGWCGLSRARTTPSNASGSTYRAPAPDPRRAPQCRHTPAHPIWPAMTIPSGSPRDTG